MEQAQDPSGDDSRVAQVGAAVMKRRLVFMLPLLGFALLTLLYEACVWLMAYLGIAFPGALVAMLILYLLLMTGLLPLWLVESACRRLLEFMPIYFVPFLVGIMTYRELLAGKILSIFGSVILSFAITLVLTGLAVELVGKFKKGAGEDAK